MWNLCVCVCVFQRSYLRLTELVYTLLLSSVQALSAADASYMTKVLRENIINVKADVEVQQKDPNSPLYSVKTFEELNLQKKLLDGVYNMGFNKPSKIQVDIFSGFEKVLRLKWNRDWEGCIS